MARKFSNGKGLVYRAVVEFSYKSDDTHTPYEVIAGPYTRQGDATAALTREGARRNRKFISGRVQVGTVNWEDVMPRD